jgi:hypothetical protein
MVSQGRGQSAPHFGGQSKSRNGNEIIPFGPFFAVPATVTAEMRGNSTLGSAFWNRTAATDACVRDCFTRYPMGATMLSTVLIVLLILLLLGAIPSWPYSRGWGYGPSGILGLVLIVVLILALTGRV